MLPLRLVKTPHKILSMNLTIKFKQFLNPYCKINIQTDKTNNQCYARIYLDYGISHMRSTAIVRISVIEVTGDRHADRCDG